MIYLKWFGWIIGFCASAFFMLFFIGEGLPEIIKGKTDKKMYEFFIMLLCAVAGYILSFFQAKTGGILQIAGGLSMTARLLAESGKKNLKAAAIYGLPFILSGGISLIYGFYIT